MTSLLEKRVREQLDRYLRSEMPLTALQRWLVPATWSLDLSAEPLVADVLLRLAEFSGGDWTEWELREALARLVQPSLSPAGDLEVTPIIRSEPWIVRFVPFGTIQIVISSPGVEEEKVEESVSTRDEVIRGTAVTRAVSSPEPSLQPI